MLYSQIISNLPSKTFSLWLALTKLLLLLLLVLLHLLLGDGLHHPEHEHAETDHHEVGVLHVLDGVEWLLDFEVLDDVTRIELQRVQKTLTSSTSLCVIKKSLYLLLIWVVFDFFICENVNDYWLKIEASVKHLQLVKAGIGHIHLKIAVVVNEAAFSEAVWPDHCYLHALIRQG